MKASETNLRTLSQRRKGGGETSLQYHTPKTLNDVALRQAAWQPWQTWGVGENSRETKEELPVFLRLGLQIGITWKFWGEKPWCLVSLRLSNWSLRRWEKAQEFWKFPWALRSQWHFMMCAELLRLQSAHLITCGCVTAGVLVLVDCVRHATSWRQKKKTLGTVWSEKCLTKKNELGWVSKGTWGLI